MQLMFLQSFAEMLHETVRKDLWAYAGDEVLTAVEMHKIKYEVSCLQHTYVPWNLA